MTRFVIITILCATSAHAGGYAEPVHPVARPEVTLTCRYVRPDGTLIRRDVCERVNDPRNYRGSFEPPREEPDYCYDGCARPGRPGERPTGTPDDPTGFIDREPDRSQTGAGSEPAHKGERK